MISIAVSYEKRFGASFPGLTLAHIRDVLIPVTEVKISYVGEKPSKISPAAEYCMSFIGMGMRSTKLLSQLLGLEEQIVVSVLADEITSGRVIQPQGDDNFMLTKFGEQVIQDLNSRQPIRAEVSMIFDRATRQLRPWRTNGLISAKELGSDDERFTELSQNGKVLAAPRIEEMSARTVSKYIMGAGKNPRDSSAQIDVLEVLKTKTLRKGFFKAKLLIWQTKDGTQHDFCVIFDDERSKNHEAIIRSHGGLEALGIFPTAISQSEVADVSNEAGPADNADLDDLNRIQKELPETIPMPDGGSVRPADHANFLRYALQNTRERLVIIAPWINKWVVNQKFIGQLEKLLARGVNVTIAWGFDDPNGKHPPKSNPDAIRKLFEMAVKYETFDFVKLDMSHMKVLLFDSTYICTSHNWLSYTGDQPRVEWGEKRTHPDVVEDRYEELCAALPRIGHRMTEADIPKRSSFS